MATEVDHTSKYKLASRWSRFWAGVIDFIVFITFIIPIFFYTDVGERMTSSGQVSPMETALFVVYSWLTYLLCNGYLLHKKGQTIGKNVFEIAIVDLDERLLGLPKLLVKRSLPMVILGYIPFIGSFMSLINILFIFRKDKRCLHDLIAGTKVIDVTATK
ncbi:RDD family protein [Vibrio sp. Of7-15]|uniref:RDD family protein n=1 Tax=Vibrio sp. Of7-15 TaxID=2724879 RepID=UPI001EF30FC9|nr:RDD family protein [Vibrio sp. Of7-15]